MIPMPRRATRSLAVVVCALVCSMTALLAGRPLGAVRTEDRNRDGRPDVWRSFDHHGRIARISVDTNFDGRSDVEEFYEDGALVRRQTDRDFNDRIDLVQHFDASTRLLERSLTDVDADGVADLLVLFHEGQPVYQKYAESSATELVRVSVQTSGDRTEDDLLLPLDDPFSGDLSLKSTQAAAAQAFAPYVPVGIPRYSEQRSAAGTASNVLVAEAGDLPASYAATVSTRAPPFLRLFF
jgi:hypothetical protein